MVERPPRLFTFATLGLAALDERLLCAIIVLLKRRLRDNWEHARASPVNLLIVGPDAAAADLEQGPAYSHRVNIQRQRSAGVPGLHFPLLSTEIQQQLDLASLILEQVNTTVATPAGDKSRTAAFTPRVVLREREPASTEPLSAPQRHSAPLLSNVPDQLPTPELANRDIDEKDAVSPERAALNAATFKWVDSSSTQGDLLRLKMLRWPQSSVLQLSPHYLKIATVLTFTPLSLSELVAKSGSSRDVCVRFAYAIMETGHGVIVSAQVNNSFAAGDNAALSPLKSGYAQDSSMVGRKSIFARIRVRLGL
jgi:hypothetical protein